MSFNCAASSFAVGRAVFAAGKRCECTNPLMLPASFEALRRHVAIGALLRLGRIVKRARPLPGDAAGLPVVILVETTDPPIVIDRHILMHLVADGTELRRLRAHEWLEKNAAMRFGIQADHEIVQRTRYGILCRSQFVQFGILEIKIGLAHRAFHAGDGMAHHATQSGLRFRTMHDLLDRRIHQAAVKNGRIVASTAPFRGLGADGILHVFDRLAVPLIIKRRKMVRRAEPLVVDILVATLAGVGLHEKLAGDFLLSVDLRGTGKERALRTVPFAVHAVRRHSGILNAVARLPTFADVAGTVADPCKDNEADSGAQNRGAGAGTQPTPAP